MPFPWVNLITALTTDTLALNVPFADGDTPTVSIGSGINSVTGNILSSPSMSFIQYAYPYVNGVPFGTDVSATVDAAALVGFRVQILQGLFTDADCNPTFEDDITVSSLGLPFVFFSTGRPLQDRPPGPVVYDYTDVTVDTSGEILQSANLSSQRVLAGSMTDIPDGVLTPGQQYTARVIGILATPDGPQFGSSWYIYSGGRPFYTRWGSLQFSVNAPATVTALSAGGAVNPTNLSFSAPLSLGFTLNNPDGPAFAYQIQVGTPSTGSFSPNIWDSGLVSDGPGSGTRTYSVLYAGQPLQVAASYVWRVRAYDGMAYGPWSAAASFGFNQPPTLSSIEANGSELLFGNVPTVSSQAPTVTWTYNDEGGGVQSNYSLVYSVQGIAGSQTISGVGPVFSAQLGALPNAATVDLSLTVGDGIDQSQTYTVQFVSQAPPVVSSILIDSQNNPVGLADTAPTISWTFQDLNIADLQSSFQIQVATDILFQDIVWDTGPVSSSAGSAVYGSTPSPVVAPAALTHGMYYVRVYVSDGVSTSSPLAGYFAINSVPNNPSLLGPAMGGYSGVIPVSWQPASPPDGDGDAVTYTVEMTPTASSNMGWTLLAGPLPQGQTSYAWDITSVPAGDNYAVRVLASDGFSESNPNAALSPRFEILNHAPNPPFILQPEQGGVFSSSVRVEWVEANPLDVDGDTVIYMMDVSSNASAANPSWQAVGTFQAGTTSYVIDASSLAPGSDYKVRMRTFDEHGAEGAVAYSGSFSVSTDTGTSDFETFNGNLYVGTSDGRILMAKESVWQYSEDWTGAPAAPPLLLISTPGASIRKVNGTVVMDGIPGQTCILRQGNQP